jgi:predicted outer membrane protein
MLLVGVSIMIFAVAAPALASQPAAALAEPDRALLIAVRQAGLWEIPASQRAQEQAASQVVKDVGTTIAEQHARLGEDVDVLAQRMGVELPDQANEDQQKWLAELDAKSGEEFDRSFAQLLRAANGELFAISSQVRATTRNDVIREFTLQVNDITQDHLILLESTGQVDFYALPEPVLPGAAPANGQHGGVTASASTAGETSTGVQPGLVVAICLAEAVVTVGLLRLFRSR